MHFESMYVEFEQCYSYPFRLKILYTHATNTEAKICGEVQVPLLAVSQNESLTRERQRHAGVRLQLDGQLTF